MTDTRSPQDGFHYRSKSKSIPKSRSYYYYGGIKNKKEEKPVGSGDYGTVSIFQDPKGNTTVVKEMPYSKTRLNEYKHEAELNLIVHGIGDLDVHTKKKICYLRMKKLPPTLDKTIFNIIKHEFKEYKDFLKFFIFLLNAVRLLHQKFGIIHGDLKWPNICRDDKTGEFTFCDFGLSRKLKGLNDKPELTSGTWKFICSHLPEELINKIYAHPSQDVYSLGYLLKALDKCIDGWRSPYSLTCFTGSILSKDRLGEICKQMMDEEPEKRPAVNSLIKYCVDAYNALVKDEEQLIDDAETLSILPKNSKIKEEKENLFSKKFDISPKKSEACLDMRFFPKSENSNSLINNADSILSILTEDCTQQPVKDKF